MTEYVTTNIRLPKEIYRKSWRYANGCVNVLAGNRC